MRTPRVGYVFSLVLAMAFLVAVSAPTRAEPEPPPGAESGSPPVDAVRADLAARLALPLDEVEVVRTRATAFPDAALGLPEPGKMYAQVVTPGFALLLRAAEQPYLYTATTKTFRYGGPLAAWQYSVVRLEAGPPDPNLNANVLQTSLVGTNPDVAATGVMELYPQADGSLLLLRRTSRSGQDLLYRAPDAKDEPRRLYGAFAFGEARVDPEDPGRWAAIVREHVGGPWVVARGRVDGEHPVDTVALPEHLRPVRLWWRDGHVVVQDREGTYHELGAAPGDAGQPGWRHLPGFSPPEADAFRLNKSQTLDWRTLDEDGRKVTQVARLWFTGSADVVARIPDFEAEQADLSPERRFLLLAGRRDEVWDAVVVDLASGEVLRSVAGASDPPRLLAAPPPAWTRLAPLVGE